MELDSLVSVVVRTKNRYRELKKALESIFEQTYQKFEVIIVDSSDTNYEQELKSFFKFDDVELKKLKYFYRKNLSSAEALNFGIKESNGKYIAFLDDDDEWLQEKLKKQLSIFDEYAKFGIKMVICWVLDKRFDIEYIDKYPFETNLKKLLEMLRFSSTSSYLIEADFLKNVIKGFDENFPSAQEYELAVRVACNCSVPILCIQEVLVIQHKSSGQITRNWKKKKDGLRLLLKKHKLLYTHYSLWEYSKFRLKFFGMQCLYTIAYVVGDKIYNIIIPIKRRSS